MHYKKAFLLATTLAMFGVAEAQPQPGTFSIIPKIGVSTTNLIDDQYSVIPFVYCRFRNLNDDVPTIASPNDFLSGVSTKDFYESKYRTAFSGGIDFQWLCNERWAFVTGIGYSLQGCKYENTGNEIDINANGSGWNAKDIRVNMHFLTVPVMGKLYIGHGFALNGGLQFGWLCKAHIKSQLEYGLAKDGFYGISYISTDWLQEIEANKLYEKDIKSKVTDRYQRFEVSVPLGISYEYGPYVADIRTVMGVNDIGKKHTIGNYRYDFETRSIGFTFSLGYRFDFNIH